MGCARLPQRTPLEWYAIFNVVIVFHLGMGLVVGFSMALAMTDMMDTDEDGYNVGQYPGLITAAVSGYIAAVCCLTWVGSRHCKRNFHPKMNFSGAFICYLPYSIPVAAVMFALAVIFFCVTLPCQLAWDWSKQDVPAPQVKLSPPAVMYDIERPRPHPMAPLSRTKFTTTFDPITEERAQHRRAIEQRRTREHRREVLAAGRRRDARNAARRGRRMTPAGPSAPLNIPTWNQAQRDISRLMVEETTRMLAQRNLARLMARGETPMVAPCVAPGAGSAPVMSSPAVDTEAPPAYPSGPPPKY